MCAVRQRLSFSWFWVLMYWYLYVLHRQYIQHHSMWYWGVYKLSHFYIMVEAQHICSSVITSRLIYSLKESSNITPYSQSRRVLSCVLPNLTVKTFAAASLQPTQWPCVSRVCLQVTSLTLTDFRPCQEFHLFLPSNISILYLHMFMNQSQCNFGINTFFFQVKILSSSEGVSLPQSNQRKYLVYLHSFTALR